MIDLTQITVHILRSGFIVEVIKDILSCEYNFTKGNEAGQFKISLKREITNLDNIQYNYEVKIYYGNDLVFGGKIQQIDIDDDGSKIDISGYSYVFELCNKTVNWKYQNNYVQDIVKSLLDLHNMDGEISYVSGISIDNFSVNVDSISFQNDTISNALQKMADLVNANYWVDVNKKVYFKADSYVSGDVVNTYIKGKNMKDFRLTRDSSSVKNRGFLFGGPYAGISTNGKVVETIQNSTSMDLFGIRDFAIYDTGVTTSGYAQYKLLAEMTKYADPTEYGSFMLPGGDTTLSYNSYINLKNIDSDIDSVYITKNIQTKVDTKGAYTSVNFESRMPDINKVTKELEERIARLEKQTIDQSFLFNMYDRFTFSDYVPWQNFNQNICLYDSGLYDDALYPYEPYIFLLKSISGGISIPYFV